MFKIKKANFEKFFYNKFPGFILQNVLVASILFVINDRLFKLKNNIDETLNTDI